jgi:hypothetical protein
VYGQLGSNQKSTAVDTSETGASLVSGLSTLALIPSRLSAGE